ncbi:MAG TPA: glycosyltransferase, partial [Actinomycetes bacterium]|nr:glycosyltransferase [Actinomycetes bacterium]
MTEPLRWSGPDETESRPGETGSGTDGSQSRPDETGSGTDEVERLVHELAEARNRLAAAEAQLGQHRRSRFGVAARLIRAAVKDPLRRRSLPRDLGRALLDRSTAAERRPVAGWADELPDFPLPDPIPARPELRVAVLLDPAAELAWQYEWHQVALRPADWRERLRGQPPKLLFAAAGADGVIATGDWDSAPAEPDGHTTAAAPGAALPELLAWCRQRRIPTVLWSTAEGPPPAALIPTARRFDHVLVVDADRITDYQRELGHDRVSWLPFGAQPRLHNPIRRGPGRAYDVAFAGSFRSAGSGPDTPRLDQLLTPALAHGLHIYPEPDRAGDPVAVPARYRHHVQAALPYQRQLAANNAHKAFIVDASSGGSKTWCRRQLFELAAAQTAVISPPSAAVTELFGEDVEIVHDAEEAVQALATITGQDDYRDRLVLRAHRHVYDEHLLGHRVQTVLTAAGLPALPVAEPTISVVVPTNRPRQLDHVLGFVGRQSHPHIQLILVQHGFSTPDAELAARAAAAGVSNLVALTAPATRTLGGCLNLGVDAADGDYLAKMDDDNFYGRHYLRDLVRAFAYTDAAAVGKWAHLVHLEGSKATLLRFGHAEHRYTDLVQGGT